MNILTRMALAPIVLFTLSMTATACDTYGAYCMAECCYLPGSCGPNYNPYRCSDCDGEEPGGGGGGNDGPSDYEDWLGTVSYEDMFIVNAVGCLCQRELDDAKAYIAEQEREIEERKKSDDVSQADLLDGDQGFMPDVVPDEDPDEGQPIVVVPTDDETLPEGMIRITGRVTYAFVPAASPGLPSLVPNMQYNDKSGLIYSREIIKPVRGAQIEAISGDGSHYLGSGPGNLGEDGIYTFVVPADEDIVIIVKAALGSGNPGYMYVADNTAPKENGRFPIYRMVKKYHTPLNSTKWGSLNMHAESGWVAATGQYNQKRRFAGPFAILDSIYGANKAVRQSRSWWGGSGGTQSNDPSMDIHFTTLPLLWSVNNTTEAGHGDASVGSTHFSVADQTLTFLGKADLDTDEYDPSVVCHEWSHYLCHLLMHRSDNTGGSHSLSDVLDPTKAFNEGFADALSSIVRKDSTDVDTWGAGQALASAVDYEKDSHAATATVAGDTRRMDGEWSEASIAELIWDLFDGGPGWMTTAMEDVDKDGIYMGEGPSAVGSLLTPLVNMKDSPAFLTINSYLSALKHSSADKLARKENISAYDEFEQTAPGRRLYTTVPANGTRVALTVDNLPCIISEKYGTGNKLYNRLFFKVIPTSSGPLNMKASPYYVGDFNFCSIGLTNGVRLTPAIDGRQALTVQAQAGVPICFVVTTYVQQQWFTVQCGDPAVVTGSAPLDPLENSAPPGTPAGDG